MMTFVGLRKIYHVNFDLHDFIHPPFCSYSNTQKYTWHTDPYCPSPVDLWQTFEVDSLEHLEALELVTARLERKVSLCKANVMMVTCFDGVAGRRRKKRRRKTADHRFTERY